MRPGAGAEIVFLINIYCSQFGGCWDEEKTPLRHISYGTTEKSKKSSRSLHPSVLLCIQRDEEKINYLANLIRNLRDVKHKITISNQQMNQCMFAFCHLLYYFNHGGIIIWSGKGG